MPTVRIIATPPGEAPQEIREAWVGLELPLLRGFATPRKVRGAGILTGPRTWWQTLRTGLAGAYETMPEAYVVDGAEAWEVLARHDLTAALWWKENAAVWVRAGARLAFPAEVCELVER